MHLKDNTDDETPLHEESEDENVPVGVESRVPCPRDEVGKPVLAGFPEGEDWLETELRRLAYHEAAHAVIAWKFGVRCRIEIDYVADSSSNEATLQGRCTRVSTFRKEVEEEIHKAAEQFEATGECEPLQLGEDAVVLLTDREIAAVCIAGRVAEWMLFADGERVHAGDILDSLEYDPLTDSDRQGVEAVFPELLDSPGIVRLVEETVDSLWAHWDLVQGLAKHLIRSFHREGFVVLTDGMFAEIMIESEVERAGAERPEIEGTELEV